MAAKSGFAGLLPQNYASFTKENASNFVDLSPCTSTSTTDKDVTEESIPSADIRMIDFTSPERLDKCGKFSLPSCNYLLYFVPTRMCI